MYVIFIYLLLEEVIERFIYVCVIYIITRKLFEVVIVKIIGKLEAISYKKRSVKIEGMWFNCSKNLELNDLEKGKIYEFNLEKGYIRSFSDHEIKKQNGEKKVDYKGLFELICDLEEIKKTLNELKEKIETHEEVYAGNLMAIAQHIADIKKKMEGDENGRDKDSSS